MAARTLHKKLILNKLLVAQLSDVEEGDVENQGREGLDGASGAGAVAEIVRDHDLPAGAGRHLAHGGDPACDQLIESECGRSALLGLVEDLSIDQLTRIIYCHETLGRRLRAVSFRYLAVHHAVEHDLHARSLGVFLQELLVPELVCIIYWWHITIKSL